MKTFIKPVYGAQGTVAASRPKYRSEQAAMITKVTLMIKLN